jgi:two-component system, LuxR family, response regulator FixJ
LIWIKANTFAMMILLGMEDPWQPANHVYSGDAARTMNSQSRTIAVVDDDAAVCESTRFLLEANSLDVQTYLSGADFLRENPDVSCVIVDYQMPGLNGLDLMSELRQRGSTLPAIMITATSDPTVDRRAAQFGITQVLRKPLSGQALLGAIRKELD